MRINCASRPTCRRTASRLFSHFPANILLVLKKISVPKGSVIQRKGDINSKIYEVESGLLRSYALDENGKEYIFMIAPEGWIVADSCPPEDPCDLYIDAVEDTTVRVFDKTIDGEIVDTSKLLRRMSVLQKRIMMLMSASAIERYEHFVEMYPQIVQRVPQRMIASYLGITPEALSKVKGDRIRAANNLSTDP